MVRIDAFQPAPGDYPYPVLPPKAYTADLPAIQERFVVDFPGSKRRSMLFEGLARWVGDVQCFEVPLTVWIDGSFVEGKEDPDDVDLWTFADGVAFLAMTKNQQLDFLDLVMGDKNTLRGYHCHTFCSIVAPSGHPRECWNEHERRGALHHWGQTRPAEKSTGKTYSARYPKGFVVLSIGKYPPEISVHGVWP